MGEGELLLGCKAVVGVFLVSDMAISPLARIPLFFVLRQMVK